MRKAGVFCGIKTTNEVSNVKDQDLSYNAFL